MKKVILIIPIIAVMFLSLVSGEIEIIKDLANNTFTLKIDKKVVFETENFSDIEKYLSKSSRGINGDFNNVQYDGYCVDWSGHVTVHCHTPSPVENCALEAEKVFELFD